MKDIVLIGAGGIAKDVCLTIEEINRINPEWNILGIIDDNKELWGQYLNEYKILGGIDYLNSMDEDVYAVITIGDGVTRKKIVDKTVNRKFAVLIGTNTCISKHTKFGEGTMIFPGNIISGNVVIGKHVLMNLACTIGHDAILHDYATILPGANISGIVEIGEYSTIGTGSAVIQEIKIGNHAIVGAGSVVIRNVEDNCTVVGNPGKYIHYGQGK